MVCSALVPSWAQRSMVTKKGPLWPWRPRVQQCGGVTLLAARPPAMLPIDTQDPSVRARLLRPRKCIQSDTDIHVWQQSDAHHTILLFLMQLGEACVTQPTRHVAWHKRDAYAASDSVIDRVLALLIDLDTWTVEIEPHTGPHRFGNLAFRSWGARLQDRAETMLRTCLPPHMHAFITELYAYLVDAFGSFVRIDYGTGHELHMIAWLAYLYRLGALSEEDAEARIALEVIPAYLHVVWHLQDRYRLEPAGSHGVWGLDDYHFVPYILGAAQLRDATISPLQMADLSLYPHARMREPRVGPRLSPRNTIMYNPPTHASPMPNMYTSSLARIHSLKRGPFSEHSPLLYDISRNVPTWPKVFTGMLKMYDAECLLKRPVVQHFVFGGVGYVWPDSETSPPPRPVRMTPAIGTRLTTYPRHVR